MVHSFNGKTRKPILRWSFLIYREPVQLIEIVRAHVFERGRENYFQIEITATRNCVCVCVCVWKKQIGTERESKRARERETMCMYAVCVYLCACVYMCVCEYMDSFRCEITCITEAVSWWQVSRTSVQLGEPNGNDSTWTMTGTKCAAIKRLISIMRSSNLT